MMSTNNEVLEEIKKEDKKPKKVFVIAMICSVLVGFVTGYASVWMEDSVTVNNVLAALTNGFKILSVYAGAVLTLVSAVVVVVLYKQGRKIYAGWDEEDDDVLAQIEMKLNVAMIVANVNIILTYLFMGIGFSYLMDFETNGLPSLAEGGVFLVGVVGSMVLAMVGTSKVVNFQKEINPEKRGSAYDFNFQKKWLDSSDEAEKLLNYKAAYKAYKAVNMTCLILWAVCVLGVITFDWDIMPVIMVGVIWLVSYLSCNIEALKLSKHASKIQE